MNRNAEANVENSSIHHYYYTTKIQKQVTLSQQLKRTTSSVGEIVYFTV